MRAISDEDAIDLRRPRVELALAELTGVQDADLDEYQRSCLNAAIRALGGTIEEEAKP